MTAFLFDVTRPKLLQMGWFQRLYEIIIGLRSRARALAELIICIRDVFNPAVRLVVRMAIGPALPQGVREAR